jgi:hypothetical protein
MKNAFIDGYYLVQRILVGIVNIWFLVLAGGVIFYFIRKRILDFGGWHTGDTDFYGFLYFF